MELQEALEKLETAKSKSEKIVGKLLLDFGFDLVDINSEIHSPSGVLIGEIDLIFKFEDFLFIVEASNKKEDTNKIIASIYLKGGTLSNGNIQIH